MVKTKMILEPIWMQLFCAELWALIEQQLLSLTMWPCGVFYTVFQVNLLLILDKIPQSSGKLVIKVNSWRYKWAERQIPREILHPGHDCRIAFEML